MNFGTGKPIPIRMCVNLSALMLRPVAGRWPPAMLISEPVARRVAPCIADVGWCLWQEGAPSRSAGVGTCGGRVAPLSAAVGRCLWQVGVPPPPAVLTLGAVAGGCALPQR